MSCREGGEADEGLDMAFNQLPRWWNKRALDWSGSTDYTADHKQVWSGKHACIQYFVPAQRHFRKGITQPVIMRQKRRHYAVLLQDGSMKGVVATIR